MSRAKTWASGRNSSVEPCGLNSSGRTLLALRPVPSRWPCVSSQPLGRPVVPDV